MAIFGNKYILEDARGNAENDIKNTLIIFYEHISKWVFIPAKQSSSWLRSIQNARDDLFVVKNRYKKYFDQFNMGNNIIYLNKKVESKLGKKNDLSKFYLRQIYNDFNSPESILNTRYLKDYLNKYKYIKDINIDAYIDEM